MKRSFLQTAILLAVFGGMIAWYNLYEKKYKLESKTTEEKAKQLVSLSKDDIQELSIHRKENDSTVVFKFKRNGSDWMIVEPVEDAADNSSLSSSLSVLTTTTYERVVDESAKDFAPYGLVTPLVKIVAVKDGKTPPQEVWLGDDTPVGSATYAKTAADNKVYKVTSSMKSAFDKPLKDFRNKNIFSLSRAELGEIEIKNSKGSSLLKKDDKDVWQLARENVPADANEVTKLINTVIDLRAENFTEESPKDLASYGFGKQSVQVFLTSAKDKSRLGIAIAKSPGGRIFAKRDDKKFLWEVDKETFNKLDKASLDFRSLELASFNRFDLKRIKIEKGKQIVELLKEEAGWTLPAEPAVKIDSAKVDTYLTHLQDTKISKYTTEKGPNNGIAADLIVRLFEKKDNAEVEKVTLRLAKAQKGQVKAQRMGLDLLFLLKEEDAKKFAATKPEFIKVEEKKEESLKPDSKATALEEKKS